MEEQKMANDNINLKKYQILKQFFGYSDFRKGQEELIDNILAGKDVLGIMPTGAGKSICYQIPALILDGIALVVSPLISLMKDQVQALVASGVSAAYINSSLSPIQIDKVLFNANMGKYKIIYIAPERLTVPAFIKFALSNKISLITVDEAHCVSQWGQDFRPNYLLIAKFITELKRRPPITAFTATATSEVKEDIIKMLDLSSPYVITTGFDRPNLYFEVRKPKDKFSSLTDYLEKNIGKSGIIYCATRKAVEEVEKKLTEEGYGAARYHAGLSERERNENQDDFLVDKKTIMVATNAFGMGIDKSNVSFVIHYNMPKNLESYYQEAGRAGRDGTPADCILLFSGQDIILNQFMIDNNSDMTDKDPQIQEQLKQKDRERLKEMTYYCHSRQCLRQYILKYFGDYAGDNCGNCGNCNDKFENRDITEDAQKIMSCISRTGARFGIGVIVSVLRASKNEKVTRLGLDTIKTYGAMKNESDAYIRDIINYLVINEFLQLSNTEYPTVSLTQKAARVLSGEVCLSMKTKQEQDYEEIKPPKKSQSSLKAMRAEVDMNLFANLKAARAELAAREKVPAFIILSDASLIDMCGKLPQTESELLEVSGIGRVKLEKYGAKFLEILKAHSGQNKIVKEKNNYSLLEACKFVSQNIKLSDEPVTISNICDMINVYLLQRGQEKISVRQLTAYLVESELLLTETVDNKTNKNPTEKGKRLGITQKYKRSDYGAEYLINFYGLDAQRFLVENLQNIITVKKRKR